ncbi:o-succinylbenzoate synthase, partial [Candidatus Sumerlaeota bacterium]|nr:o-succinylbenzoate synthase [Candidatus Sumerlaeota bacterium]
AGATCGPDANAAYDLEKHADALKRLDEFNLAFIEQPLHHDDILDHARLGRMIKTPVCLDESLKSARVARQVLECGASRIWNIKVQRVGGLLEAIRIYALAVKHGVALWGGTMPESGIGGQAILALASFPGFVYPADIEPSARWYEPGLDPLDIQMNSEGWITVPNSHGVAPLLDYEKYRHAGRVIIG